MILKAIVTFVIAVLLFDFEKDELASRQQIPGKWEQFYLGNGESTASMPDQIIELTTLLPTQIKASVMSTFDVFVEKGRKQKTENAVRNLIKQPLLTNEQIASVLKVPVKCVADIRLQSKEA